ncbi:terpene synthase [Ceratobasidium sp. AG-Ba]|nr:terpene synthase [Ceratobasidium sp. AG-Ba]QRW02639.1 terpene synthase [Ceratobasidium sp. AG-Ba]
MPESSQLNLRDRASFPSKILMPDIPGFTGQFFDVKLNPHWQEVETESYAWFKTYEIRSGSRGQDLCDTGLGQMAALVYPEADLLHLRPSMDFVIWLFAFDDLFDEGELRSDISGTRAAINNALDVLRNPDTAKPNSRAATSLLDLFNRMRLTASPATIRHFVKGAEIYMNAALKQNIHRTVDNVPTVQEYIELRRDVGAVQLAFAVLEYSLGLDLPDEVHSDPVMFELELAANDIICWTNDMYSFPIEHAQGDAQSLVFICMLNEETDLQSALNRVEKLTQERTHQFVDIKKRLPSFGSELEPQVAKYVRGMELWMQGSIHWAFTSPRYFGANVEKVRNTGIVEIAAML